MYRSSGFVSLSNNLTHHQVLQGKIYLFVTYQLFHLTVNEVPLSLVRVHEALYEQCTKSPVTAGKHLPII